MEQSLQYIWSEYFIFVETRFNFYKMFFLFSQKYIKLELLAARSSIIITLIWSVDTALQVREMNSKNAIINCVPIYSSSHPRTCRFYSNCFISSTDTPPVALSKMYIFLCCKKLNNGPALKGPLCRLFTIYKMWFLSLGFGKTFPVST